MCKKQEQERKKEGMKQNKNADTYKIFVQKATCYEINLRSRVKGQLLLKRYRHYVVAD